MTIPPIVSEQKIEHDLAEEGLIQHLDISWVCFGVINLPMIILAPKNRYMNVYWNKCLVLFM